MVKLKAIILVLLVIVFVACGSSKTCNSKLASKDCPADGTCLVTLYSDKALVVSSDELGKLRYEMVDDSAKNVIIYTYNRTPLENVQDGTYREEVILELDKNQKAMTFSGALSKTGPKALFGRFCYCKGSTGFYKISSGSLTPSDANESNYVMNFKITEVPQVIQKIQFKVK